MCNSNLLFSEVNEQNMDMTHPIFNIYWPVECQLQCPPWITKPPGRSFPFSSLESTGGLGGLSVPTISAHPKAHLIVHVPLTKSRRETPYRVMEVIFEVHQFQNPILGYKCTFHWNAPWTAQGSRKWWWVCRSLGLQSNCACTLALSKDLTHVELQSAQGAQEL